MHIITNPIPLGITLHFVGNNVYLNTYIRNGIILEAVQGGVHFAYLENLHILLLYRALGLSHDGIGTKSEILTIDYVPKRRYVVELWI